MARQTAQSCPLQTYSTAQCAWVSMAVFGHSRPRVRVAVCVASTRRMVHAVQGARATSGSLAAQARMHADPEGDAAISRWSKRSFAHRTRKPIRFRVRPPWGVAENALAHSSRRRRLPFKMATADSRHLDLNHRCDPCRGRGVNDATRNRGCRFAQPPAKGS